MVGVVIASGVEVAHHRMQRLKSRCHRTVQLTQHDGSAIAEHDLARCHPVGAEVDEGADGPVAADDTLDDQLVEPVL